MCEDELINKISIDIKTLLSKLFHIEEEKLNNITLLTKGELLLDSMQIILLISAIEKHFDIIIDTNIILGDNFHNIYKLSEILVQGHGDALKNKLKIAD